MGTRNLTIVISGGTHKLAQYGQWDGFPDTQGIRALIFCKNYLVDIEKRKHFVNKLESVKFVDDEQHRELLKSVGIEKDYYTHEESERFFEKYPYFSRNHGAKILELLYNSKGDFLVSDAIDFAADSFSCEWGYVIDLDKNTFEVYKGFNKNRLFKHERFFKFKPDEKYSEGIYHPIRLVKEYSLFNLPTEEEFLDFFKIDEE